VYWTAGYTTDFEVSGFIAFAHPQLAFLGTATPRKWQKTILNVTAESDGTETCAMSVANGPITSRIQCTNVEYKSAWQNGWISVLSNPLELRIPVD
jgi:hypothetical protein